MNNNIQKNNKLNKLSICFKALLKLNFKAFYSNPRGIVFTYIVPTFFILLFYYVISIELDDKSKPQLLFNYLLLPGLIVLTSLSTNIVSWKETIFLKRIDNSGIPKWLFLSSLITSYFLIGLSGISLQFCLAFIIGGKDFIELLSKANIFGFIFGIILTLITSIVIACFLGGIFRNEGVAQAIVMMFYFLSIFLSGIMIHPSVIYKIKALRYFTYLIPQKYPTFLVLFATNNKIPDYELTTEFPHQWIVYLGSFLMITTFFIATLFTFKWNNKS